MAHKQPSVQESPQAVVPPSAFPVEKGKRTNLYLTKQTMDTATALTKERGVPSVSQLISLLVAEEQTRPQRDFELRALKFDIMHQLDVAKIKFTLPRDARAVDIIVNEFNAGLLLRTVFNGELDQQMGLQQIAYSAAKYSLDLAFIVVPETAGVVDQLSFSPITSRAMVIPTSVVRIDLLVQYLERA